MGMKFNERFENHMDGIDTGTKGDAKRIDEFEEDPYDDDFEDRLSSVDANVENKTMIDDDGINSEKRKDNDESASAKRGNISATDGRSDVSDIRHSESVEAAKDDGESSDTWSDDDQELWDNDFGAINEDAINYEHPEYIKDGVIKPNWGSESVDTPEQTVLPEGTRIMQYSHHGQSGVYFAPEGTKFDDLQLPDSQDKRIEKIYEVQEGGLSVSSSEIAIQPWNKKDDERKGTGAQQFVADKPADRLVEDGKIKPVDGQ